MHKQKELLIAPCDKNLGPAIIQTKDCVKMAFRDHLNNSATYKSLTPRETAAIQRQTTIAVEDCIKTHKKNCTKMELKFLQTHLKDNTKPFARFCLTPKAHKLAIGQGVEKLKSRPIASCPGSLLHPLGMWVDRKLQRVSTTQPSYFRNTFDLRQALLQLQLPSNARTFTADAVSMCTNIPTNIGILTVGLTN